MRRLAKVPIPTVLAANGEAWLAAFLADSSSANDRMRYRHPEIKEALRSETGWKCVYCESKIGHNAPGDIEHKVPTSKRRDLHFVWENLTIACAECNRRKNDYYEEGEEFLDPYLDDVEECLVHLGPLVYWKPGHARAEISVRTLELDSGKRAALLERKRDTLEKARSLLDLIKATSTGLLRALRQDELDRMHRLDAEYSAMVLAYVTQASAK
jgi:HNH endonuclease